MPLAARIVIDRALEYLSEIWCNDLGYSVQCEYQSETFENSRATECVQGFLERSSTAKEKIVEIAVSMWSTAADLHYD